MAEKVQEPQLLQSDLKTHVLSSAAEYLLSGVQGLRERVRRVTDQVANGADLLAERIPLVAGTIAQARDLRLIEKVNIRTLPPLLSDPNEDLLLKAQILDHLDSPIAATLPFVEVVETIAKSCFDRGIDQDLLIDFFTNPQILKMMVDETIVQNRTSYRANNLVSTGASIVDGLMAHVRFNLNGMKKQKVDPQMAEDLKNYLAFFKENYDPNDLTNTFTQFIDDLEKDYPQHDIRSWLRENKDLLASVIFDPECQQGHVAKITGDVYLERGKSRPSQFITMNCKHFLQVKTAKSTHARNAIAQARGVELNEVSENQQYLAVDIDCLNDMFETTFLKLANKDFTQKDVQVLLLKVFKEELDKLVGSVPLPVVFSVDQGNTLTVDDFEDTSSMWKVIESQIRNHTQTLSSHIDVLNLLSEPEEVPEEITRLYQELFNQNTGELHEDRYNEYLKSLFGAVRKGRRENITTVKNRVEAILQEVSSYFYFLCDELNLNTESLPHDILKNCDYADLIRGCANSEDPRDRFFARLKLELAAVLYSCESTPRKVYQDHDAKAIAAYFLQANPGLRIRPTEQVQKVTFYEDPSGNTFDFKIAGQNVKERTIPLLPAKFGDVNCQLLLDHNGKFVSKKSLHSMVTKLLHRDQVRAKDLTDLIRMTIVCETDADIRKVKDMLETHYLTFGRQLKRIESKGTKGNRGVKSNKSKSQAFKVDAYVADVPVEDVDLKGVYSAPTEVMITDLSRLKVQSTMNNELGHRQYELRRVREVITRLLPHSLFPEYYEVIPRHPHDRSKKTKVGLIQNSPTTVVTPSPPGGISATAS